MLRLALIGRHDAHEGYRGIASRIRNVHIAAVADVDESETADGNTSPSTESRAHALDALLANHSARFDAILFHSAGDFSEREFARAAKAGKHVFCDVPLPTTNNGFRQIAVACRDADVRLMVGPGRRFSPALRTIKENVAAGRLGAPGLLRIHRWRPRPTESPSPPAVIGEPGDRSLFAQLVVEIDVACWLFSRLPSIVYAVSAPRTFATDRQGENRRPGDYLQVHLGFSDGGMALIDLAHTLPAGAPYDSLTLIGSTGAAYADDHHNMQLLYRGSTPAALATGAWEVEKAAQLHEFVSAIEEHREASFSEKDVLQACEIAEAAIAAASTGRSAPMTEEA